MSTTDKEENILYCAKLPQGISEFTDLEMTAFSKDLYARLISAMMNSETEDGSK
jgi:hypothetical protein